jgi:hypothetical protein
VALPHYQKLRDAGGKRLGSPALRKVLSEAGQVVSDRDARWLVKNLPAMDTRTAMEKFVAKRKMDRKPQMDCQTAEKQSVLVACGRA